jgi:hypothetical protein
MQTVEIVINDDSETLSPGELAEFLYLFPAANFALGQLVPKHEQNSLREPTKEEEEKFRQALKRFSPDELDRFFNPHTSCEFLQINHICRNSPLEMTLCGCAFLITLGVIFSGGKISMSRQGLKAELPPLGKGLKSLREALGLNDKIKATFGIREVVVKLNEKEYNELRKQDDASKSKGGFQHFLVGLKNQINKQTRELILSPSDLERIHRYKANPRKGGWQSRFKKIFGRHFPVEEESLL